MTMKYESPDVEIIDFVTLERLAGTPEQEEAARDGSARNGGGGGNPNFSEGVMPWG